MLKFSRLVRLTSCHMQRALPPSRASTLTSAAGRLHVAYQDAAQPSPVACARGAPFVARRRMPRMSQLDVITTKPKSEARMLSRVSQKHRCTLKFPRTHGTSLLRVHLSLSRLSLQTLFASILTPLPGKLNPAQHKLPSHPTPPRTAHAAPSPTSACALSASLSIPRSLPHVAHAHTDTDTRTLYLSLSPPGP